MLWPSQAETFAAYTCFAFLFETVRHAACVLVLQRCCSTPSLCSDLPSVNRPQTGIDWVGPPTPVIWSSPRGTPSRRLSPSAQCPSASVGRAASEGHRRAVPTRSKGTPTPCGAQRDKKTPNGCRCVHWITSQERPWRLRRRTENGKTSATRRDRCLGTTRCSLRRVSISNVSNANFFARSADCRREKSAID